jgi:uncharacterized membrane protein
MKPLIVLLFTFAIALIALHLIKGGWNDVLAANIALAVMLLFTAFGHFVYREGMILMIPEFIPAKREMVLLTGIWEICFAAGLCVTQTRYTVSFLLILFLLFVLPANINAALKNVDYRSASYEGSGIEYLWLRIPVQFFLIFWVVYFNLLG